MTCRLSSILLVMLVVCGAVAQLASGTRRETPVIRATVVHRPVASPKLLVEATRHNFGLMDVDQIGEHTFTLRNVGDGDLDLRLGNTSCQCTVGELADGKVLPGGETQVRLAWQPPKSAELFAQGATIHTNDPENPSVYLHVVGQVKRHLAASQDSLLLKAPLGESTQQHVMIYSQAWDSFTMAAQCDHPVLSVEVQPASEEDLKKVSARAGYQVTVTMPAGLPLGPVKAALQIQATTPLSAEHTAVKRELELPIYGHVRSRVSVQGASLEDGERLQLGTLSRGQGKVHTLAILVRGDHDTLAVRECKSRPAFLRARLGAREQVAEKLARYKLEVEVPTDAPTTHCVGNAAGELVLSLNHPDAQTIRLSVDFAVLETP